MTNTGQVMLFCVLIIGVGAGCAAAARGADYASLKQEAEQRLAALKESTEQAAGRGIDVAREGVTITTAELFLKYADWDAQHPDELRAAIAGWWRVRTQAEQISRELPKQELRDVIVMLDAARSELVRVLQRPSARRPVPRVDMSALMLADGYWRYKGRPVFPSSFVWMPDDRKLNEAYGSIGGAFIHLPNLQPDGGARIRYRPKDGKEPMGYVFMGQKHAPKWLIDRHPDITVGAHHFTGFDIDHPAVRKAWSALLAAAVPEFAGRNVSQGGYLLTNEPHWFTGAKQWATGPVSGYTMAKFRAWIEQRHKTIHALNRLWGSDFASFDDVAIEIPIDTALRGKPVWYDWCRFNMDRVAEWFAFLQADIRGHDPGAKVHIKLIPGLFTGAKRSHGLDFEALVRLQDIIGCDAQVLRTKSWRDKGDWDMRYACDWRNLSMPYDFFRSVGPGKLLFDSEFHGLSTVHWRDPDMPPEYVHCIYWLAHLHGMGMNQTWYWGRERDGAPKPGSKSGFYASNLALPRVMDAFGRTLKELNAFAPEVVALATQPKPVRLFYSEASAIQDGTYMDRVYEAYRALYHLGAPLGFATGRMLAEATHAELRSWPVLLVSYAQYVTAANRAALSRYASQGGTLLIVGRESLKRDEYGRLYTSELKPQREQRVAVFDADDTALARLVLEALQRAGMSPPVRLKESNAVGQPGCVWRTAPWEDGQLLLILNLGKSEATINIDMQSPCRDMFTGQPHPTTYRMKPFDVKLLHVKGQGN